MKLIFEERKEIGEIPEVRVYKGRKRWNDETQRYDRLDEIERDGYTAYADTVAYWDKSTGVLCVDQRNVNWRDYDDALLPPRRILETITQKPAAQRRAIELADEWIELIRAAIPAPLSDDEVMARHKAQETERIPY